MTTASQDAQACPTCDADPSAAPSRYCASLACRCGHPACPAAASWVPREGQARAAATVSDARTGVADVTIRGTKTAPAGNRGLTKDDARSRNG